ncbi:hypothetical protein PMIN06_005786 [Paraphaeosphaeria minitans]
MAPSVRHRDRSTAPKTLETRKFQAKQGNRKYNKQVRKPAVPSVTRFIWERSRRARARDEEDHRHAGIVDLTLPKGDKERETWARKLYSALISGPNLCPEAAGDTAWTIFSSTEELFRYGPSVAPIKDIAAPVILDELKNVTFTQHFDDLVRFVDKGGVESDVIGCTAEELLVRVARAKRALRLQQLLDTGDVFPLEEAENMMTGCIDLTMESSEDETGDDTDAGEDDAGAAEERRKYGDLIMLESVPTDKKAATGLRVRTVPHNAAIIDLTERSESKKGAEIKSGTVARKYKDTNSSAEVSIQDRASYFDPDPFWMAHLETMRNKRRFVGKEALDRVWQADRKTKTV